jgi:hypothetical protein
MASNSSDADVFGRRRYKVVCPRERIAFPRANNHSERQPTEGGERSHVQESVTFSERKLEPGPRGAPCPDLRSRGH